MNSYVGMTLVKKKNKDKMIILFQSTKHTSHITSLHVHNATDYQRTEVGW